MKAIILILFHVELIFSVNLQAQDRAVIKNDTVYYQGSKLFVNQPLRLAYGSNSTKDFAFVYIGTALTLTPADARWAKQDILIEKITAKANKIMVRAKIIGNGPMLGNKIYFDVEAAIDNKEIAIK